MTERLDPYELFAEDDFDPGAPDRPAAVARPPRGAPPMSAAGRQRTCAACGAPFTAGQRSEIEPLLDGEIRYVAVHPGHSTHPPRRTRRPFTSSDGDGTASFTEAA
jgi:hypothetical protein